MVEGLHLNHLRNQTSQGRGQCRCRGGPVCRVGNDNHVGGKNVSVCLEKVSEGRRTGFFFTLNEDTYANFKIVAEGFEQGLDRGEVGHNASFVVGCSPAKDSSVN